MARLVYSAMCSLDGFIADADGSFDFAMPDAAVHAFANELESTVGTHLFGRRMFEVMEFWEGQDADLDQDPVTLEFARQWTSRDKHVYSTTLTSVTTARTTLHRAFEPRQVAQLKADATADLSIGGCTRGRGVQGRVIRRPPPHHVPGGRRWRHERTAAWPAP